MTCDHRHRWWEPIAMLAAIAVAFVVLVPAERIASWWPAHAAWLWVRIVGRRFHGVWIGPIAAWSIARGACGPWRRRP